VVPHDRQSPLNKDYFGNLKAQGWWELRNRFERTHRAVNGERGYAPDQLISLDSSLPLLRQLMREIAQPTRGVSTTGKLHIDKQPDSTKSPNLGDATMQCYWPVRSGYDSSMAWVGV
jgi:phage terminase large subunit